MNDNRLGFIVLTAYSIAALVAGGLGVVKFEDVYRWGLQQDHYGYNESEADIYTPPNYAYAALYIIVISTILYVGICAFIKHKTEQKATGEATKTALSVIWGAANSFNIMFMLLVICEFFLGVPQPYFLGYKKIFCTVNGTLSIISNSSAAEINQLCQPFPSFLCAALAYCVIYLYLQLDHLKIRSSLNSAQHNVMIFMGGICFVTFSKMYSLGDAYLDDILLGVLFGAINAVATVRFHFGSVFYYTLPKPNREMKILAHIMKKLVEVKHAK